jgi:hypothetical protein
MNDFHRRLAFHALLETPSGWIFTVFTVPLTLLFILIKGTLALGLRPARLPSYLYEQAKQQIRAEVPVEKGLGHVRARYWQTPALQR